MSARAVSDENLLLSLSRELEGDCWPPPISDASEVGDIDEGEEGRVESLDTDTEETEGGECGGSGMS